MVIREETAPVLVETEPLTQCQHYWIIEPANGPVSQGVCQNCQEVKEFQNTVFEMERDY